MLARRITLALVLTFGVAAASAAPEFTPYEGKNAIQEGDGGEKKTVDGVDFWINGAPPRKFKLLGFLADKRHKTGLVGMIRTSGLESAIAKEAKKAGGDAVILVSSEAETTGYVGQAQTTGQATTSGSRTTGNSWTNAQAAPVQKQLSKYAVVQYLPDTEEAIKDVTTPAEK